jgi:hypothetical protein
MSESTSSSGLTGWLAANRNQGGLVLMIAGIVLAAIPVWLASQYGAELLGIEIIAGLVAALFLFVGVVLRFRPEGAGSPIDEARVTVLTLGGVTGLSVSILGIMLNVQWWDFLTRWLRFGERDGAWKVLLALVTLVAGLAIMFLTLASARSEERSSPVLRRLIYGYNAVLSGILLFLILVVVNTLAFVKLPAMVDSTESGIFKLSDRSKQVLRGLEQPTTVYLIMPTDSYAYDEMKTLLANAQEFAPRLKVETLSTGLSAGRIRDLAKQYPELVSDGVLIVQGEGKGASASFIKSEDIVKDNPMSRERSLSFEGEARLMTELVFLSENKQKTVVYFTNGNANEFDLNDADPRKDTAIGTLKRRLESRNYDVRPLKFEVADPKVPDDAAIVVLPNPRQPYTQPMVAALQKYMTERKGKLVLLTSATSDRRATTMPDTGLEALLAPFKVELTKERILMLPVMVGGFAIRDPEMTLGLVAMSAVHAKNPIAVAFERSTFVFEQSRVVRPSAAANPNAGDSNFRAETLIETAPGLQVWAEADVQASARQLAESLRQNSTLRREKLSNAPLPMTVLVSESPQFGMGETTAKPRLAVFGMANFITNPRLDETRGNPEYFDLFAGTLDWLRERPSNIGIEPRTYKNYMLSANASGFRLVLLPGILALVAIVGLGAGVWVARRR